MNTRGCAIFLSQLLCFAFSTPAQSLVRFDQARYDINPGETFQAQVLISPAPTAGLYSYGVQLVLPPTNAQVAGLSSISVPPLLDFNGARGAGAPKVLAGGLATVKGTVNFSFSPIQPYSNSLVVTFRVTDLAGGPYVLRLAPFNTLGPTEEIFVDGSGSVLDPQLTFGTALVNYKPLVRITSPTNGAIFFAQQSIHITAEASDPDGSVTNVTYFEGTNSIGTAVASPYLVNWTGAPPGVHIFNAVATDNLGASATSSNVFITIKSNSPPVLAPIANKTVVAGTLLSFTATATDPDAPPQTLTFSLDPGAPTGASITTNGLFTWTPTTSQAPSTNPVTVRVTDNGIPPLSDQHSFLIYVTVPTLPTASYAIFAGETNLPARSQVLYFKGEHNTVAGDIHSNSGIKAGGQDHTFRNGLVEYVTDILPAPNFRGIVKFESSTLVRTGTKPYPVNYVLSDFAPGGPIAAAAQAAGKYFYIRRSETSLESYISHGVLREGLYYVQGKVNLRSDCLRQGRATIVATDEIQIDSHDALLESYTDCVLAFSGLRQHECDKPAIQLSGRKSRWQGVVFAPWGVLDVHGQSDGHEWDDHGGKKDGHQPKCKDDWDSDDLVLVGSLVGKNVRINAKNFQITGIPIGTSPQLISSLQPIARGNQLQLCFPTISGLTYAVEYSDSLVKPDWRLWRNVEGDGGVMTLLPPAPPGSQRYYRMRLLLAVPSSETF